MSETQKSTNHRQQRVTGWKKTKGKVSDNNAAENFAKQDAMVDNSGLTDAQNDSNILHQDVSPHRKRQDPTIKYVNPLQNGNGPGARTSSHPHVLNKRKEYGEGNIKTPIRDFCAQVLENQENHDEEKYPSTAAHYYKTPSQHSPINSLPKITQRYSFEEHDSTSCVIQPDTHPSGYTNSNHSSHRVNDSRTWYHLYTLLLEVVEVENLQTQVEMMVTKMMMRMMTKINPTMNPNTIKGVTARGNIMGNAAVGRVRMAKMVAMVEMVITLVTARIGEVTTKTPTLEIWKSSYGNMNVMR
ncbi:hypothetical protein FB446DRAFT_795948 [Lentinula raphanica]|nr:hypothetical protein FB446DRAFT_795948 [Lentinula raphanica]